MASKFGIIFLATVVSLSCAQQQQILRVRGRPRARASLQSFAPVPVAPLGKIFYHFNLICTMFLSLKICAKNK